MEMKVDRMQFRTGKRIKMVRLGLIIIILFAVPKISWSQEVTARLLIEVQGKIAIEDESQILQGDNGRLYLLQGKKLEEYAGKEVRVLGEPIIPPEDLKGKIRLVINVLEVEKVNQGGEGR
jgi:hypothetical protein